MELYHSGCRISELMNWRIGVIIRIIALLYRWFGEVKSSFVSLHFCTAGQEKWSRIISCNFIGYKIEFNVISSKVYPGAL